METQPEKNPEMKNYTSFLNYEDFNLEPIIKKCKEDVEYKKITAFHLRERLLEQENPEFLNKDYINNLDRVTEIIRGLLTINDISKEMVSDFLLANNINEPVYVRSLSLYQARDFMVNLLNFFDKRLSSTILALEDDKFEEHRETLTKNREILWNMSEKINSEEFELLPRDQGKIEKLKERLALIENL
jgi:flagellin-specific chaperone FliS